MAIITLLPQAVASPWPEFSGVVSSPTVQGHAMTNVFASPGQDVVKSCLWGGFPSLPPGTVQARLKGSWAWQNAFHNFPDEPVENLFHFFYNPTGPGALGLVDIASINNASGNNSGDFDIEISLGQNMANLYVMDILRALSDASAFNNAQIEAQVTSLRVEATTKQAGVLLVM